MTLPALPPLNSTNWYPHYAALDAAARAAFRAQNLVVVEGNDQTAIAAAVAKLPLNGGHLHFPGSDPYTLTAGTTFTGYSNLTITSDGAPIVAAASWADILHNSWPNYGQDSLFRFVGCTGLHLEGLHIDGNIANRVAYGSTVAPTVYGNRESFNSNILLIACQGVMITRNTLVGAMTDNVELYYDSTYTNICRSVRIVDNEIREAGRNNVSPVAVDGFWLTGNRIHGAGTVKAAAPMSNVQLEPEFPNQVLNVFITDNDIYGAAGLYGVSLSGQGVTNAVIEGNTIRDHAAGNGLNVSSLLPTPQATGVVVRGNRILNNAKAGLKTDRRNIELIEGNIFAGNQYGLNSSIAGDVTLVGNHFVGNTYEGAVFTDFVSVRMVGNRFENNASPAGLADGAGRAVFGKPVDATAVFTFDANTLTNTPGATSLMKGVVLSAACNARGNGNTGINLSDNSQMLMRVAGVGNHSLSAGVRGRAPAGDANFDDNLWGGGRLLIASKYHYGATAAPTTGTWEKGDVVYNTAPATGKPVRWVCLVNGTPGYWQADGIAPSYGGDMGDATVTVKAGVDNELVRFDTTLTANRDLGLSTVGAWDGARFRVKRSGGGAFTLNVGGIKTLAQNQWVDVMFDGAAWRVTASGSL